MAFDLVEVWGELPASGRRATNEIDLDVGMAVWAKNRGIMPCSSVAV